MDDHLVYLTSPWRERLESNASLMRDADELGSDGYRCAHYHSIRTVVHTVANDSHAILAAFLRNEPSPDENEYIAEYRVAHNLLMTDREDEYAEEIAEAEQRREAFQAKRPPAVSDVETRSKR